MAKFMSATAELLLMERDEEREARLNAEARANQIEREYNKLISLLKKVENLPSEIRVILEQHATK